MPVLDNRTQWKILLVLLPIALFEVCVLAPLLVPAHPIPNKELFVNFAAASLRPEPLKAVRYLLLIGTIPIIFFVWLKLKVDERICRAYPALALALELVSQVFLLAFVLHGLTQTNFFFDPISQERYWYTAAVIIAASWGLFALNQKRELLKGWVYEWAIPLVALGFVIINLSSDVFTWNALTHGVQDIAIHLPGTMDQCAAALCGRTMLVNYFPIYQNLSEYFLQPVFGIVGLSPLSFTLAMAVIAATGFALVYAVLRLITGQARWAAALFIPYVTMSFCVISPAVERMNNFSYYQNGPLRYFGPWVAFFLTACCYARPGKLIQFITFFTGTLVAINNLDFGLPALAGSFMAFLLVDLNGDLCSFRRARDITLQAILAGASAISLVVVFTLMRSGSFPQFDKLIDYQRVFAVHGFFTVPLPDGLFYWFPLITWMVAIFLGLQGVFEAKPNKNGLLSALLIFSGIYGCGSAMYFVGRSRWENLIALFPTWGLSLVLVLWTYFPSAVAAWRKGGIPQRVILAIPIGLGCIAYAFSWSHIIDTPNPVEQWRRITAPASAANLLPFTLLDKLKETAKPGETVMIIYPHANWLARQAGLNNSFPFIYRYTMLLRSQLDLTMGILRRENIHKVYGCLPEEMQRELTNMGFVKRAQLNEGAVDNQQGFDNLRSPFEYWELGGS
jgi:hypothetical protein